MQSVLQGQARQIQKQHRFWQANQRFHSHQRHSDWDPAPSRHNYVARGGLRL